MKFINGADIRKFKIGGALSAGLLFAAAAALLLSLYFACDAEARAGRSGGSSSRSYRSSSSSSSRSYSSSRSSYGRSSYGSSSSYRRSYPSSYGGGYGSGRGHFSSAIILFFTFIIIAVIGVIHFLTSRSSGSGGASFSSFNSSPLFSPPSSRGGNFGGYGGTSGYGGGMSNFSGARETDRPDLYELKERVKEVFMHIQESWGEREASYAEDYASQRLYFKHQSQIEDMINKGEKNVLNNIRVIDVKILEATGGGESAGGGLEPGTGYGGDYSASGRMKALIRASMIDYVINEDTGRVIDGDDCVPDEFCEQWNFIYNENGWVADEIIPVD